MAMIPAMKIEPGRIRLVTFDLYDTLIELEPKRWERLSAVLTARGITHDPAILKANDMVAEDYWTEINAIRPIRERDEDVQDEIRVEYIRRWLHASGVVVDDACGRRDSPRIPGRIRDPCSEVDSRHGGRISRLPGR